MDNTLQTLIQQAVEGATLTQDQATRAFQIIMNGGATPAQIAALLTALKMRGESVEEIAGAAEALRVKAKPFVVKTPVLDTCGTGGSGLHTLNVSTAVALVLAGGGVSVVKHGNRAVSSASGSADVLEQSGVTITATPDIMQRCLDQANIAFLYAPAYHTAMRHVAPIRQELKFRTIFNILGPLINPARPTYQLLGVYSPQLLQPMAQVLQHLGTKRALIVCGEDGMDEITLHADTRAMKLEDGHVSELRITPEDAGLPRHPAGSLQGGDAMHNAKAMHELFMGVKTPYRDAVLLNAAAAFCVADKAGDLAEGVAMAATSIDDGHAMMALQRLVHTSRAEPAS